MGSQKTANAGVVVRFNDPAEVSILFSRPVKNLFIRFFLGNLLPRWERLVEGDPRPLEVQIPEEHDRIIFEVPTGTAVEMKKLAVTVLSSITRELVSECGYISAAELAVLFVDIVRDEVARKGSFTRNDERYAAILGVDRKRVWYLVNTLKGSVLTVVREMTRKQDPDGF